MSIDNEEATYGWIILFVALGIVAMLAYLTFTRII